MNIWDIFIVMITSFMHFLVAGAGLTETGTECIENFEFSVIASVTSDGT